MINLALFKKELRELRWVLFAGTLLMAAMGIAAAASFKLLENFQDLFTGFFQGNLLAELEFIMSDYNIYIWSQWNPKNLLQLGSIVAIIAAAPAIAGEYNRGSLEFLISRPLKRSTMLLTKAAAGITVLSAIIWLSTLAMLFTAQIFGPEPVSWWRILAATLLSNAGLLLAYAVALNFSVLFNDSIKAGSAAAGALFVYSGLSLLRPTRILSFFYHMRGLQWFTGGNAYPWIELAVMVFAAFALILLAARLFKNREY